MHLAELVRMRTQPCAGLLLALTQRCPLSCAHCSTSSSPRAPQHSGAPFRRLVGTFTAAEHPELVFMSGGEPLLRPRLVADLATAARAAGTRSCLLSGMFFARADGLAPVLRHAIAALDHFSASLDEFHEREVGRERVLAALATIADLVAAVSLHVTAASTDYLDDVLPVIRRRFGQRVPVLVSRVQPTGRARTLLPDRQPVLASGPCEFAGWPLVDFDGTVFACSRQSLARAHRPAHLVLGHAGRDSWPELRRRSLAQPALRAVRSVGPVEAARRAGASIRADVCATCVRLPPHTQPPAAGVELLAGQLLSRVPPRQWARRWGAGDHADLVELGWTGDQPDPVEPGPPADQADPAVPGPPGDQADPAVPGRPGAAAVPEVPT
ncbi:MAG TPA: radical SAM protein [Micromonosporaceae bacterium]|nr:radical SAM protein [Micromonosporaceae bacterium]